uniref:Alkaline ceramidase n=1 Tax=Timema californicum TaxID=61474 RepID=A0A7R9IW66_TIMCA|nr:unnamed protein product [Timema californicum]
MWRYLEPGSSPVDWCEGNYLISPNIAEFGNTVSNILFIVCPPLMMSLYQEYCQCVHRGIHALWVMLIFVGLCSAYFHATLSFIGQLLDEVAILWLLTAALCMFYPKRLFPTFVYCDRKLFSWTMGVSAVLFTALGVLKPIINSFALMVLGSGVIILLLLEIRRMTGRMQRLGLRTVAVWVLAVACWIADRVLCDTLRSLHFPYLHAIWHILIFIASYTIIVIYSHAYVGAEFDNLAPILTYWPKDNFELGIPYITIHSTNKKN